MSVLDYSFSSSIRPSAKVAVAEGELGAYGAQNRSVHNGT